MSRVDLDNMGVLSLRGRDVRSFLQGQLTNDMETLSAERSLLAAVANAQGRVVGLVRVIAIEGGVLLWLPLSEVDALRAHLSRFVLRAQVELRDESATWRAIGVTGPEDIAALVQQVGVRSVLPGAVARHDALAIVALEQSRVVALGARAALEQRAVIGAPAALASWELAEVRAGIPTIGPQTRAFFVPQMLNLDLLGALNFSKGCYTGQEVIARTQHLGRIKRRMLRARSAIAPPAAGTPVLARGEVTGHVVRAEADERGGCELLATVSLADRDQALTLEGGASIELLSLPYAVPDFAAAPA